MKLRFNKNKGSTLIEVLISITIFSIVSIPLSMTVISAIQNNKKGEDNQNAVAVSQQIVEQIRANNTTTPNIVTINTGTNYNLNFTKMITPSTGYDLSYSTPYEDVGKGLEANVIFERKLSYKNGSATNNDVYNLNILMDSNDIDLTGTNSASIANIDYNSNDEIKICNNNDNTIQLQDNTTSDVLYTYKPIDGLINNIKINYSPNYGPHKIYLENNSTDPLSVYIYKHDNEKENTYTNLNGSIKVYDNLSDEPTIDQDANGIYDIYVDIYKGDSTNKVKIYSTKTSISLGT